jgi:hypothetical protein
VLLPEGWYMLDFLNEAEVRGNLVPRTENEIPGGSVVQERRIGGDRVEKTITVRRAGDLRVFSESVRLFTRSELESILRKAGFRVVRVAGDYDGAVFQTSSPRCILFGQLES